MTLEHDLKTVCSYHRGSFAAILPRKLDYFRHIMQICVLSMNINETLLIQPPMITASKFVSKGWPY